MKAKPTKRKSSAVTRASKGATGSNYHAWSGGIAVLLEEARRQSARHINAILTATYWEIGRRIVEFAQQGEARAEYGDEVLEKLSHDLTKQFGKGFSKSVLFQMRGFYLAHADIFQTLSGKSALANIGFEIFQTVSGKSLPPLVEIESAVLPQTKKRQTPSGKSTAPIYATASRKSEIDLALYLDALCHAFPLSWSHYTRLLSVEKPEARHFYETESLRGGWSVRQLDRQISTLFYERTALAKNKAALLTTGAKARPEDAVSVEEEIKSPFVLEFLGLRDDIGNPNAESQRDSGLKPKVARHELPWVSASRVNNPNGVVALRSKRDTTPLGLKFFTAATQGSSCRATLGWMTQSRWDCRSRRSFCSEHDEAVARYSMGNLTNKILAAQYKLALPDPRLLEKEIEKTRRILESRMKLRLNNYKSFQAGRKRAA